MSGWRRRAKLFIAKGFQIRYISLILIFMFAIVLLTGYTFYVTAWVMFGEKLAAVYPQGLLLDIFKRVNLVLLLRLAIVTPLVIFIGLILSNRIAGPIYHIKKYLSKISAGNYEEDLKLRKNDELQDVAESINSLVARLRSERDQRRSRVDALKMEAEKLADGAAIRDELEKLEKM
jgi:signal transduction histidine kinase